MEKIDLDPEYGFGPVQIIKNPDQTRKPKNERILWIQIRSTVGKNSNSLKITMHKEMKERRDEEVC
jgi:hypothetical protein